MAPYVRLVRRLDFRAIRTLSQREWTSLLRRSPFGRGTILAPGDVIHVHTIPSWARTIDGVQP